MSAIHNIILARKDEEILKLYRELQKEGHVEKVFELRAAYIRKHTVEAKDIRWSNLLQTFVFEEALYLLNLGVGEAILKGKEPLEYKNKDLQISRITSFLVTEMINRDLLDVEDLDAKEILFKEILLLSPRFIAEQLSVYLFDILSGNDTSHSLDMVLAYTTRFLSPIDTIKEDIQYGRVSEDHLTITDFLATTFLEGETSQFILENIQNTYGFLFAYYLERGDLAKSKLCRNKFKNLLREDDFLHDIACLFDKLTPNNNKVLEGIL